MTTKDTIRTIWCRELALDRVGDDEDFFDLGGHSLIMARIQRALGSEIGVEIGMDQLFRHSTVARLDAHLQSAVVST